MRILVFGAGALGSVYAARLAVVGHDVTILARGQRLAQLRGAGIIIEDAFNGRTIKASPTVIEHLGDDDTFELGIVLVRKNQLASVLPGLAGHPRIPSVLVMTNNAAGPGDIVRTLGEERVLLGFPGAGGGVGADGRVSYAIAPAFVQPTTLGELDGKISPRLQIVAALLQGAGFPTRLETNMDAWLKTHAAWVTPVSAAILLEAGDTRRLARSSQTLRLLVASVRENFGALDTLGIQTTPPLMDRLFRGLPEMVTLGVLRWWFGDRRSEVYMARHARRAVDESAWMADELRALAHRAGVQLPASEELFAAIPRFVSTPRAA